jgi:hypothetical protein
VVEERAEGAGPHIVAADQPQPVEPLPVRQPCPRHGRFCRHLSLTPYACGEDGVTGGSIATDGVPLASYLSVPSVQGCGGLPVARVRVRMPHDASP